MEYWGKLSSQSLSPLCILGGAGDANRSAWRMAASDPPSRTRFERDDPPHGEGREVVVAGGVGGLAAIGSGQTGGEARIFGGQRFLCGFVVQATSGKQFHVSRAALHV